MIEFRNASFHYGGENGTGEGVDDLSLTIGEGEVVLFCGRSGCGKTTVTRMINGLAPHFYEGFMEGAVYVDGVCVSECDPASVSELVGSVFQNPKSQFFNVDTTGELAFGCENQALPRDEIRARVDAARRDMKLDALMDRNIFDLSGGEKQQIACGSVYASNPKVYVMDEPSSNLDRKAMRRLHDLIAAIKEDGRTVVVSEHRLYYLIDLVDRFIYLDDGRIVREYRADELRALSDDELRALGLRSTDLARMGWCGDVRGAPGAAEPALEAVDLSCNRGGVRILDIDRMALPAHSIVALIGDNGSGKSTLSEALCGVIPSSGSIAYQGTYRTDKERSRRSFMVMQDVNRQLFSDSVLAEVMLNAPASRQDAEGILAQLDLSGCIERHPASLSGGQKQRVAIASALAAGKEVVFYDEPTSGLDRSGMERFASLLREMRERVDIQVVVTHDPELVMQACTHVMRMDNGRVTGFYPLDDAGAARVRYYFMSSADDSTSRKRERWSMFGKILSYAGAHRRKIYGAAALMAAGAAFSVVPYLLVYGLIDAAIAGRALGIESYGPIVLGILVCEVMYSVLYISGLQVSHRAAYATLENIRCKLQEKLDEQPLGTVRNQGIGALKKLFIDDVESIELLLAHMIPEGIANVTIPVVAMLVMVALDWRLALLTVLMVLFGVSASRQMYTVGTKRMGSYFAATKRLNNTVIEYVNGMEVVRVFNRERDASEKFKIAAFGYRDMALAWYRVCWPWMAVYGSLFSSVTLYSLPIGALLVLSGQLALTDYVLVLCLSFGIGGLLSHAIGFMGALPQVNYKIQSLEKAIDRMPLKVGTEGFAQAGHDVVFEDVRFGYGNDEVIKGVSFTAQAGSMTALVGASGSGKSTVARLIAHQYDVESGRIMIGGQDVRDLTLEALNDEVSYVSQELFLFNMSILENIRIGRPAATDEEVRAAARRAQCDEFVQTLEHGYDTLAGSAGGRLSGGQRQRIAFARAILKDAPVIVLDEATAFIDPENAARMNAAVRELVQDKTVIVIAHRLASIVGADRIVVLEDGRVLDSGTHESLVEGCAAYRRLWHASAQVDEWVFADGGPA